MEYHPYKDETEMRLMIYNFKIYSHIVQDILPNQKVGKWLVRTLHLSRLCKRLFHVRHVYLWVSAIPLN